MDSTWQIINKRVAAMKDRNDRMDDTAKLLRWDDNPYKLVRPDGTELRDAISVTPNLPKVFAHGVIADLLTGQWQTVVEGQVSGRQSHYIESFVEDCYAQADDFVLKEHGISSLFGWACNHVCIRWAIGARYISQVKDGEFQIDCLPVDMRWTPFLLGKWVAPILKMSKEEVEEHLEKYEKSVGVGINRVSLKDEKNEVRDYWDSEKNEVWVNEQLVLTQPNPFGHPPFVIVVPSSGFMLRDEGYLKYEGEDILFLNAGLYKELARSISLEQTLGYKSLFPPQEYETDSPDASPTIPAPKIDETLAVKTGERHFPLPVGDINRAGMTARADIQEELRTGNPLSPREYTTPPSGVLLAGEQELISRLQNVRKEALGIFRSQLAKEMISQFISAGKGEFSIGKEGRRMKYTPAQLGDPHNYTISYHLSVKSKRQELANLAEFAAVYDKLPLKWNLTNILMADDPDGIINALELQKAKQADPAIGLSEMGIKYAEEAEEMEDSADKDLKNFQSMLLIDQAVRLIKARMMPTPSPEVSKEVREFKVEQPKASSQLLTQLGGAAGALRGEGGVRKPKEVAE